MGSYLFDTTQPLMDYFRANIEFLTGGKTEGIKIFKDVFPTDYNGLGLTVNSEIGDSEYPDILAVAVRINSRAKNKNKAWGLILNVDNLINMVVRKMLTDTVELVTCKRNTLPSDFKGNDGKHYYTALYSITERQYGS